MRIPCTPIGRYDLTPGQWVVFDNDKEELMTGNLGGPFKVINRYDSISDTCRCSLMNAKGNLVDYCPRIDILALKNLPPGYKVKIVGKEEIAIIFGVKLEELQSKALEHLKNLALHKYLGKGFNPDDESTTLSGKEIREKYGLTLQD